MHLHILTSNKSGWRGLTWNYKNSSEINISGWNNVDEECHAQLT